MAVMGAEKRMPDNAGPGHEKMSSPADPCHNVGRENEISGYTSTTWNHRRHITPKFRPWNGEGSLIEFALSLNLHRRHLTQSQRACLANDVLPIFEAEAKARQVASGGNQKAVREIIPEPGRAREKASASLSVNNRYVSDAKKLKETSPQIFAKVREGAISLPEDQIIDGRNRFRACEAAGVKPRFRAWDGSGSLTAFVVGLNLHRRHLDDTARAMVAARIKPLFEAEAKARQIRKSVTANWREQNQENGTSASKAAEAVDVSSRSVERAARVLEHGSPELIKAVDTGAVAISTAATITELPKAEQSEVVARGEEEPSP